MSYPSDLPDDTSELVNEIITQGYQVRSLLLSKAPGSLDLPVITFVGTEVVGKSSLINALFGGLDVSSISPTPQDLKPVKEFVWAGILNLIDCPGYIDESPEYTLHPLDRADVIVHVCDIGALRRRDIKLAKFLHTMSRPLLIVLNKCDGQYYGSKRARLVQQAEEKLQQKVICVSAKTGEALDHLLAAIIQSLPEEPRTDTILKLIAQNRQTQGGAFQKEQAQKRRAACEQVIGKTSREAAQIGAGKVPGADLPALIALYKEMVRKIAGLYASDDVEIVPLTVDSHISFVLRAASQALAKLVPIVGPAIGAATALLWTKSIGEAAIDFYEKHTISS